MNSPVIYVYVLAIANADAPAVFTWPNPCRKFIRDTYTADGRLALPPEGRLKLTRHKVNPKAGGRVIADVIDIGEFLNG